MNLWRFGPLESWWDILQRFFPRLLCCFVGSAVYFAVFAFRGTRWLFFGVPIAIGILGLATDVFRLRHPEISVQRLGRIIVVVIVIGLPAFTFVNLWVRK